MVEQLNNIAIGWWQWMSSMFWQVSLLIIIIFALDVLLRKKIFPQLRYTLWLLVLIKLIISPDFSLFTGVFTSLDPVISPHISINQRPLEGAPQALPEEQKNPETISEQKENRVEGAAMPEPTLHWTAVPILIWILGILVYAYLLVSRIADLARWHKDKHIPKWYSNMLMGAAKALKLEHFPSIVFSDEISTPAVYGFFRPVMVLPRQFTEELSRKELYYMTLHELAHLKRKDLWVHGLAVFLQGLYWFNPLIYLAQRKLKDAREVCCDLTVNNALKGKNKPYRQTLVNAARRLLTRKPVPALGLLGVFEEPGRIINRINWLERDMINFKPLIAVSIMGIAALFIVFVIPMADSAGDANSISPVNGKILSASEFADGKYLHVQTASRRERMFLGIVVKTTPMAIDDLWMNEHKIAMREEHIKVIVDLEKNEYIQINLQAQSYIKSTIPVDQLSLWDDETRRTMGERKFDVELENTGQVKEILGRKCQVWRMKRTITNVRGQQWGGVLEIWVDSSPDIDYEPLMIAIDNRRRIFGADKKARETMMKMRGLQHRINFNSEAGLFDERIINEAQKIEYAMPPEGTFEVPEYYTQKEKLGRGDL